MKRLIVIVLLSFCLFACTKFILNESNNNISNQDFAKMGLHRLDYNDILDSVGQWHNDYQDYLLKKIVDVFPLPCQS
jgi:hypothetical protein